MTVVEMTKAIDFFKAKLEYTTGPVEVERMIENNESIRIVDVRYPADFSAGRVPGSVNLPPDKWGSFEGLDRDKTIIVYCYSHICHLAAKAALKLAEHGFAVMEMEGGFDEWQKHQLPVEH